MLVLWLLCALVIVLVVGCGGASHEPRPVPAGTPTARHVVKVLTYQSTLDWRRSPYWRLEDDVIALPVFLLVAGDGTGCIWKRAMAPTIRDGEFWPCMAGWRVARP